MNPRIVMNFLLHLMTPELMITILHTGHLDRTESTTDIPLVEGLEVRLLGSGAC